MTNLIWTDRGYNQHSAEIGAFTLNVGWDSLTSKGAPSGFKVSFAGRTLKKRFSSLEEGKEAGVVMARKLLSEALATL
jgi:hypothetical protein